MKTFIIIAAINAAMSVGCGAFGAHGLEGKISEKLRGLENSRSVSDVPCRWIIGNRIVVGSIILTSIVKLVRLAHVSWNHPLFWKLICT